MDGNKRPRRRRRRGIETVKSLLILLLSLSAVYLTLLTLDYSRVSWAPLQGVLSLFHQDVDQPPADTSAPAQSAIAPRPVRIGVSDGTERYVSQYDTQETDQMFEQLSILLSESLDSASSPQPVEEAAWRQALEAPGVWFDFLGTIPLDVLYAWMGDGGDNPALIHSARRVAVALDEGGGVCLYYHNEADGLYYACATAVAYEGHMDALVSGYGSNGYSFVFELEDNGGYEALDPYVLLAPDSLRPPVYRASNPLSELDDAMVSAIQQAASFQPQSNSVYPVANGIRIREGRETLEIGYDGVAVYHAGDEDAGRYPVGNGKDLLPLVETTWRLAADTVGRWCGEARLYLMGIDREADGSLLVRYGYTLNGADVLLPDGACAAQFTVSGGQITDYTLYFRRYEQSGQTSPVLRERQAAAALEALQPQGRELILSYSDTGGDTAQAGWTAR